jgi:hypothetical protein
MIGKTKHRILCWFQNINLPYLKNASTQKIPAIFSESPICGVFFKIIFLGAFCHLDKFVFLKPA